MRLRRLAPPLAMGALAMAWMACPTGGSGGPHPADFGTDAGSTCLAQDARSLLACLQSANGGAYDRILISGPIACSGPKACAATVYQRQRPLVIAGDAARDAGLFRTDDSDYALLAIANSSNVTVRDLQFADPPNLSDYAHPTPLLTASNPPCPIDGGSCAPTIWMGNSDHVTFEGVTVLNSRWVAMQLGPGSDVTVSRSRFLSFWLLGLQLIDAADASVKDNVFQDGRNNALIVSGSDIEISGNVFDHDHNAAAWWVSADLHQPSSGGLVYFYNHLHRVNFHDNEIRNARFDDQIDPAVALGSWGLETWGVEMDYAGDLGQATDMSSIRIADNSFHDLKGGAIFLPLEYANDPALGITIERNIFHNCVDDPFTGIPIAAQQRTADAGPIVYRFDAGNCYDPQCSPQPAPPAPPAAPTVISSGRGCSDGYGVWLIGRFHENAYVHVRDAVTSALLEVHMGPGAGPYQIPGLSYTPDAGGGPSLAFCLSTPAARAAFADAGVRAFVIDPISGRFSDGTLVRGP
jgi:hypothetical protein